MNNFNIQPQEHIEAIENWANQVGSKLSDGILEVMFDPEAIEVQGSGNDSVWKLDEDNVPFYSNMLIDEYFRIKQAKERGDHQRNQAAHVMARGPVRQFLYELFQLSN